MKTCPRCGIDKQDDEYYRVARGKDHLSNYCRPCTLAYNLAWREKHRARINAQAKERRLKEPEKRKAYLDKTAARRSAYEKAWRKAHPEKTREYNQRAWAKRKLRRLQEGKGMIPQKMEKLALLVAKQPFVDAAWSEELGDEKWQVIARSVDIGVGCRRNIRWAMVVDMSLLEGDGGIQELGKKFEQGMREYILGQIDEMRDELIRRQYARAGWSGSMSQILSESWPGSTEEELRTTRPHLLDPKDLGLS